MNETLTRLAALIEATGLTQAAFAKRAGLSLAYIKKLKTGTGDKRDMSKKAAMAIAVAFGVDRRWLAGKGPASPIMARLGMTDNEIRNYHLDGFQNPFSAPSREDLKGKALLSKRPFPKEIRAAMMAGIPWKKEMADAIQNGKSAKSDESEKAERDFYRLRHLWFCRGLWWILEAAMKQKHADLAAGRIAEFIQELSAEPWLNPKPTKSRR